MEQKIKLLEQEKENCEYWAEGLIYEHQSELKYAFLRKAEQIEEQIKELKKK